MTLTSSEKRSSSVICSSVVHARSIAEALQSRDVLAPHRQRWRVRRPHVGPAVTHPRRPRRPRPPAEQTGALTAIEAVRKGHRFSDEPMLFGWYDDGEVRGAVS